jgi:hypothetical protein
MKGEPKAGHKPPKPLPFLDRLILVQTHTIVNRKMPEFPGYFAHGTRIGAVREEGFLIYVESRHIYEKNLLEV